MKISICNLWSINNAGRPGLNRLYTKYYRLTTNWPSTTVEDSLQISPFMQNKANLLDTQMNVNSSITKDYENISDWTLGENKPNTKPIKANTKPIQSQYKPKTNPKQTQYKAKQSQFQRQKKCCSPPFCCRISKEKIIFCNRLNREMSVYGTNS